MKTIRLSDTGAAVEDVQQRLAIIGLLSQEDVNGVFDARTESAVNAFCTQVGLPATGEINDKTWSALVDASYCLGDRTLFLKMPYFHGNDVKQLQQALGALGFFCGTSDGIFGAGTETALRKFQMNLALYGDGIAGSQTFSAIYNLRHSWENKPSAPARGTDMGFARAADVLEQNTICLFGTQAFTRSVASRMSNLSLATNPSSRIVSAELLLVEPEDSMVRLHIVMADEKVDKSVPLVEWDEGAALALRLESAFDVARALPIPRIAVQLPSLSWENAGEARSAQHYAITLLDALCVALSK